MEVTTAYDFATPALRQLDAALRCPVCNDLFLAPTLLSNCGHSFCSKCIRQALGVDTSCPVCKTKTDEGRLKKNLDLEVAVKAWEGARNAILALEAAAGRAPTPAVAPDQPRGKKRAVAEPAPRPASKKGKRVLRGHESSDVEIIESSSTAVVVGKKGKKGAVQKDALDPNTPVDCPLCGATMPNSEVNAHIDRNCATKVNWLSTKPEASSSSSSRRATRGSSKGKEKEKEKEKEASDEDDEKWLPQANLALLSVSGIRTLLQKLGLPSKGNEAALKARHKQWRVIWNSNLDLKPNDPKRKTKVALIKELERWEKDLDSSSSTVSKNHSAAYNNDFKQLIAQARSTAYKKPVAILDDDDDDDVKIPVEDIDDDVEIPDSDPTEVQMSLENLVASATASARHQPTASAANGKHPAPSDSAEETLHAEEEEDKSSDLSTIKEDPATSSGIIKARRSTRVRFASSPAPPAAIVVVATATATTAAAAEDSDTDTDFDPAEEDTSRSDRSESATPPYDYPKPSQAVDFSPGPVVTTEGSPLRDDVMPRPSQWKDVESDDEDEEGDVSEELGLELQELAQELAGEEDRAMFGTSGEAMVV